MSTETGRFRALWTTCPEPKIYPRHPEGRGDARLEGRRSPARPFILRGPLCSHLRMTDRALKSLANLRLREFDHGLAGGNLLLILVAHDDVDQDPAGILGHLFRLDDSTGLDGVARPDRLDPAGLKAAMDGAGRIGPVGNHARDQPKIVHAVHDDAAGI